MVRELEAGTIDAPREAGVEVDAVGTDDVL